MASVDILNVHKKYGQLSVINDITINVEDGQFIALVGPSGCGKSTLLRIVAGLETLSGGDVKIGDRMVTNLTPKDRDIAMVFQSYALYPHKTVADNMAFALRLRKLPESEVQTRVARAWDQTLEAISEVADHVPSSEISIEYKPNEPRSFALMPDIGTTMLAIHEMARANIGVTIDFAHVLYADEMPAFAVALAARSSKLFGVHLNDGYAKRDDGLMVGTVHPIQTMELIYVLEEIGYDRPIYFDTFPDTTGMDPVAECSANIATVEAMRSVVKKLQADNRLKAAIAAQDAVTSSSVVREAFYGGRSA